MAYKRIKCLEINLTKGVQDAYTENDKALLREIKNSNKWKYTSCLWI